MAPLRCTPLILVFLVGCSPVAAPLTDAAPSNESAQSSVDPRSAPSVSSAWVHLQEQEAVLVFDAEDPQRDLGGGLLEVAVDGDLSSYGFPEALHSWDGQTGTVFLSPSTPFLPCGQTRHTVDLSVIDASQARSPWVTLDLWTGDGEGIATQEVGDAVEDTHYFGDLPLPGVLCGSIWGGDNDGDSYTADYDSLRFDVAQTALVTFRLTWNNLRDDYDIGLFDDLGVLQAGSASDGIQQPETFSFLMLAGERYYLDIGAWTGAGGIWFVDIQVASR